MNGFDNKHLLAAMYAQSLDGIFFMMLDKPIRWEDANDKDTLLDYVLTHQRITSANAAFYKQYRAQPDELLGLTPLDFFAHDAAECRRIWRTFLDMGHLHIETSERRRDDSMMWVEGDYIWLRDENGEYIGHFGIQRDITQRRETERDLLSTQTRYQALFNQSHDAVYLLDLQGRHMAANQRAADMLGYSLDDLHMVSYLETSDEPEASKKILERLLAGEAIPPYKRIFIKNGGERIPVEINVELVRDGEGTPLYIQSLVRDISRRETMQAELERRAAHAEALNRVIDACIACDALQPLFNTALTELRDVLGVDGGMIWTRSDVVIQGLPQELETTHEILRSWRLHSRAQFVVENWATFATSDEKLAEIAETAKRTGVYATLKVALTSADKRIGALVLTNSAPHRWLAEEVKLAEAVGRQLGMAVERLRLSQALYASQERYRILSEMMTDYATVVRIDADGSPHMEWEREGVLTEMTGYSRDELVAMGGPLAIILPEDLQQTKLHWSPDMEAEEAEFRIRHKDGSVRWFHRVCQGEKSTEAGVVGRLYETLRDVTERKRLEAESITLHLERERSRILSGFIRDASHEFRTPLSIINLNVYALKRLTQEQDQLQRLNVVSKQIRAMNDLVESLLILSRMDSGVDLSLAALDVNSLLVLAFEAQKTSAHEKSISFDLMLQPSLPQISGHNEYLTIAIGMILDNAVRYTNAGHVTARTAHEENHVIVEVRDTGLGMSVETQERIFERFFRLDDAHSERGFGLGLPIVQRITELHGGHIAIDSKEGKGTTVRLYLPVL